MDVLVREIHTSLRALVRTPRFTLTAILFLALGIGGNAVTFSVVNAVLLRPMPYEDPERLVVVRNMDLTRSDPQPAALLSTFEFATHKAAAEAFESIGAVEAMSFNLTGVAEPRKVDGAWVSSEVLPMLARGMHQGRYFTEDEDRPGAEPVTVVSHAFWLSELGGETGETPVSSRTLTLEGIPHTVIGVLPPGFRMLITFLTAILCTLAPWLIGFRLPLQDLLKEGGGRSLSGKSRRLLEGLATLELAMALVLVVGAGLMLRSFDQLQGAETGFPTDDTLVMQITLPESRYADAVSRSGFVDLVLAGVEGLPGVRDAGVTTALPMRGTSRFGTFVIEGREPSDRLVYERLSLVSPHYLRTLGVRLLEGRLLDEHDHAGTPGVAVVSESFARKHFPDEDSAVSQRIQRGRRHDPEAPFFTVVGVVSDVRFSPQAGQVDPSYFLSYSQRAAKPQATQLELLVRLEHQGAVGAGRIQKEVWKVDREIAISAVSDLEAVVADTLGDARFTTLLATLFGGLAFLLAVAGVYGVIVQFVQQRRHEIGVRMAMGAAANDILGMIFKRGLVLVGSGVAIGLVATFALTRLIEGQLYQVSTQDPATLVAATSILVIAALLAFTIPARQAAQVSPMESNGTAAATHLGPFHRTNVPARRPPEVYRPVDRSVQIPSARSARDFPRHTA